jgi:hypothetical protein
VALNLYLDDCSNSDLLADLLQQAGHHVVRPTDDVVGLSGAADAEHFVFAVRFGLSIITKNPADFESLHEAHHPLHFGILAVYQDNDASRDMSDAEIVRAVGNLENAAHEGSFPIHGHFHSLNDWRF